MVLTNDRMPAPNERFGATAAGRANLKGSAKCRRFAKPPSRYLQAGDSAVGEDDGLETKVQFDREIVY